MAKGYVYILTNPSMPGLVKIGKTSRDVHHRANELYQTGVPEPFEVSHSVYSPDCDELEQIIHAKMDKSRINSSREFFKIEEHSTSNILDDCLRTQVEAWLSEFIPDHIIINNDEYIDIGEFSPSVYDAFRACDMVPPDVPNVFCEIEGKDLAPAIKRWREKISKRVENMKSKKLKLVGAT